MTYITKNYSTDGGDTLVIGGKLVIEDGATVEGVPAPLTAAQAAGTASILADLPGRIAALEAE